MNAYFWLKRNAAAGVDGVTWADYEQSLEERLKDLHRRIHGALIGHYRRDGSTSRKRMESYGHWGLRRWRTRSSSAHWWRC